jgi:DNA topoisomerase IB
VQEGLPFEFIAQKVREVRKGLLPVASSLRVASEKQAAYFNVGDYVTYGKFQNKPGKLVRIFTDERGIPMIEIEPVPKGRKKNRVMGLFRVRHVTPPEEKVASRWLTRTAAVAPEELALEFLTDLGIHAHIRHGVLLVERTSMVNFSPRLEEGRAYEAVLDGLKDEFPDYRLYWGGRTDDWMGVEFHPKSGRHAGERKADPEDEHLWEVTLDEAREKFEGTWPSPPASQWATQRYNEQGGKWLERTAGQEMDQIELLELLLSAATKRVKSYQKPVDVQLVSFLEAVIPRVRNHEVLKSSEYKTLQGALRRYGWGPAAATFDGTPWYPAENKPDPTPDRAALLSLVERLPSRVMRVEGTKLIMDGHALRNTSGYRSTLDFDTPDEVRKLGPFTRSSESSGGADYIFNVDDLNLKEFKRILEVLLQRHGKTAEAKYKEKKKVPKADGSGTTTVYVYGPRQVANRNKEKAERVEKLRHSMKDLRKQVQNDLDAEDDKTRLTALAIALIDATFERVGNDDSADEGHFGVTGWLKKHLSFGKGKATIKYVGKSGVKHEKVVDDAKLVKALKGCCEDKSPDDPILSFGSEDAEGPVKITSRDVNAYLKPFDVTAKDLRGFHANREMQDQLRTLREKGPTLPKGRKEKDKILKEEFKKALEATAEAVGHEASTLRTQYLVPGLEDAYMKDGTVIDNLKDASVERVASMWLRRQGSRVAAEFAFVSKPPPECGDPERCYWVDVCPVCGDTNIMGCRCLIGDRTCGNHHHWVWCSEHHVRVVIPPNVNTHADGFPLSGCRCSFGVRTATKSHAEREDEEAERLIRESPKKKPSRDDSKRERMNTQEDPDTKKDKDLSLNYKDTGG